jgi:3D (Asp-Asp-Asp) domain-containing protein
MNFFGPIIVALLLTSNERLTDTYTVFAYCACDRCTPGLGITASGARPVEGITVAGPVWFSFGTGLEIEGVGRRVVQDRMAKRFRERNCLDLYFASHADALEFGKRKLRVSLSRADDRPGKSPVPPKPQRLVEGRRPPSPRPSPQGEGESIAALRQAPRLVTHTSRSNLVPSP